MSKKRKSIIGILLTFNLSLFTGFLNPIDVYSANVNDTSVDTWEIESSSSMTKRRGLVSNMVGDKIYCIGGYQSVSNIYNLVEVYDVKTKQWETKEPMPTKRNGLSSVVIDEKIYCMGGFDGVEALDTLEVYDTNLNRWETRTPMPTKRHLFSAHLINGKIYCFGGITTGGVAIDTVEVYDPVLNKWETKTPMITPISHFASAVVDKKVYVLGGAPNGTTRLTDTQVYDIDTDRWEVKAPFPEPNHYFSAVTIGQKIYCFNGHDGNGPLNKTYIYDVLNDDWDTGSSAPKDIWDYGVSLVGNKIYLFGGYGYLGGFNTDILIYTAFPELKKEEVSANVDIYIKSENMLSMSLDTNSVSFDNYSGVADMLKDNAIKITVNSSLPYSLKASMPNKIANADDTKEIPIDLFNIRESSEVNYSQFANNVDKIVLKDNCVKGNGNIHYIDLKLSSSQAHKADIYKAVLKFEVEQK